MSVQKGAPCLLLFFCSLPGLRRHKNTNGFWYQGVNIQSSTTPKQQNAQCTMAYSYSDTPRHYAKTALKPFSLETLLVRYLGAYEPWSHGTKVYTHNSAVIHSNICVLQHLLFWYIQLLPLCSIASLISWCHRALVHRYPGLFHHWRHNTTLHCYLGTLVY